MTSEKRTEDMIKQLSSQAAAHSQPLPVKKAFAALIAISIAYIAFMLSVFYGIRIDFVEKMATASFIAELAITSLLIAVTYILSIYYATPRHIYKPYQKGLILSLFIAICLIVAAFSSVNIMTVASITIHLQCFVDVVLFALPTTIIGFIILRKNATTHPEWSGLTTLLLAGSIGYLAVRLTCASDAFDHQAYTHLLPVALYSIMGYFLGRKILSW